MVNTGSARRVRWTCLGETNAIEGASFGRVLRELRQRAGLSQRELAEMIGTTQSAIARMEAGVAAPKFCTLEKLAEALNRDFHVHVRAVE
jgi:predicted transcriptional regulator